MAARLPTQLAIIKCTAHATDDSAVTRGNDKADTAAKKAATNRTTLVPSMNKQAMNRSPSLDTPGMPDIVTVKR